MKQKKVYITGGTTGLGLELAKIYLAEGAVVAICGRNLEKLKGVLDSNQKNLYTYQVNVADRETLLKSIDDFHSKEPVGLDIMVANAGIGSSGKKLVPDFEKCQRVFDINVHGVFHTFEGALKYMLPAKSGHLVATASVAGFIGLTGTAPYSSSKAAVINFCEALSIDLRNFNINVSCICPGFVDTPLTKINKHPMPFIIPARKGGEYMKKAIDKKKELYAFPWQMEAVILFARYIPRWLYRLIMRIPSQKFKGEWE